MTTQPETAVGSSDTFVAAEPTIEDRFSAITEQPEEENQEAEALAQEPLEGGTEPELEIEVTDDDLPAIQPPVSWTAEEKEEFNNLPRNLQETIGRRETEREKFVQAKAQEAAKVQTATQNEAIAVIEQINREKAEQLAQYARLFDMPQPDPSLIATDPQRYAIEMQQYQYYTAQRQQAQQQAEQAQAMANQAAQDLQNREAEQFRSVLQEHFPEFLDPSNAKARESIGSIALAVGYPADQLKEANATDILALKKASEWKAKADRLDTLMAKQMEKVRSAKTLPKVTRPGSVQGKGVVEGQRYETDRQAMRKGDRAAEARVFGRFL